MKLHTTFLCQGKTKQLTFNQHRRIEKLRKTGTLTGIFSQHNDPVRKYKTNPMFIYTLAYYINVYILNEFHKDFKVHYLYGFSYKT